MIYVLTLICPHQVLAGDNILLPPNLSWLCLPLYLRLFDLANSGLTMEVLEVLMKGAGMYPEYVW
ncbi:hypothetical protein EON64_05175 [archaeon]|nr:MAG: hypothetical protein EON64_05175 [archaeon]